MTGLPGSAAWCLTGLVLCAALLLLRRPAARLLGLLLRSGAGLAALALFAQAGRLIGVTLGVNPLNALVLGALGAPGLGLLLMVQYLLR